MNIDGIIEDYAAAQPEPRRPAPDTVSGRVVHVDGDYAAYYCAGGEGVSAADAITNVVFRMQTAIRYSGAETAIIHLSKEGGTKGDRYLIADSQPYQGQRRNNNRPENWKVLREYMQDQKEWAVAQWATREADDGIAYACDKSVKAGHPAVAHYADKDLRQFAGLHLTWRSLELVEVPLDCFLKLGEDGKQYGHYWFWHQMLTGDQADHIPGLPRVGPVAAGKILSGIDNNLDAFKAVAAAYKEKKGTAWADFLVEQAGLLWMRTTRDANIDDFMHVIPGTPEIKDALSKLQERVAVGRERLMELRK